MDANEHVQGDGIKPNGSRPNSGDAKSGSESPIDAATLAAETSMGPWLRQNVPTLLILGALGVFLFNKFDAEGLWAIAKAALGLSFVIFIHELGHFLAAKWCDVHVTTFSIGFGPAVPGCWFKWGETLYKLSILPLGGYVMMVGQVDGDETSDGSEDDPRSYRNKTVGQRMLIISAGVIMNIILAIVCFVIVFQGPGKDRQSAVIMTVDTGAPAFTKPLHSGTEFKQVGGYKNPYFEDLMVATMATGKSEGLEIVAVTPGLSEKLETTIVPRRTKYDNRPMLGIRPAARVQLASRRQVSRTLDRPAIPGSPAFKATPELHFGDLVVATTDPANPEKVTDLPLDPRQPDKQMPDYFEFERRMDQLAGKKVILKVKHLDGKFEDVTIEPIFHQSLGMRMQMGRIGAIREGSAADKQGLIVQSEKTQGDLIEAVTVEDPDGKEIPFKEKTLDPERLPFELRQWSDRMSAAKAVGPWKVKLTLKRHRKEPGAEFDTVKVDLDWDNTWRFDSAVPLTSFSPLAIPELGLAYFVHAKVVDVAPGFEVADRPTVQKDDVIKNLGLFVIDKDGNEQEGPWIYPEGIAENEWANVGYAIGNYEMGLDAFKIAKFKLKVDRGNNKIEEVLIKPKADDTWPIADRGFIFAEDQRRQKADGFFDAVGLGLRDTYRNMVQVLQNIRGMATG